MLRLKTKACLGALLVVAASASSVAADQTVHVEVQKQGNTTNYMVEGNGTYTAVVNQVLALRAKSGQDVLSSIEQHRDDLPPPYYLEAARRSCVSDPAAASDWLSLYSVRARYDALRCTDPSAIANVQAAIFSLRMPECHMNSDRSAIKASISKVLAEPGVFESKASPWWICSGGMAVMTEILQNPSSGQSGTTINDSQWLRPKAEWPGIQDKLITDIKHQLQ